VPLKVHCCKLFKCFASIAFSAFILFSCTQKSSEDYSSWQVYGGNKEANHYSSLTQIDTNNVSQLQVAWTYHTGDADSMTQIQVNPIIIDSTERNSVCAFWFCFV
jgi:quinoprotein glucose dehydrogenase